MHINIYQSAGLIRNIQENRNHSMPYIQKKIEKIRKHKKDQKMKIRKLDPFGFDKTWEF